MNAEIDVRHVLPTIKVPTLVMHRAGDRTLRVEEGRYVASLIPGAHFVELGGDDHLPFVGDQNELLDHIERFLTETRTRAEARQVLATILCVSMLGRDATPVPTADVDRIHAIVAEETQRFSGTDTQREADRIFAAFDGPARAIRCGQAIAARSERDGLPVSVGLHTGECDRTGGPGDGLVAAIAARVASLSRSGDVLVSRTVVDLVAGSRLEFVDRGMHALADGQKPRRIFALGAPTHETRSDLIRPDAT
jgi:class 3 adenylate cyclase